MRTSLSFLFLLTLLVLALPAVPAAAQDIDFGTVELGELDFTCVTICFDNQNTSADCDGTGTVDSLSINPPFFVRGLRKGDFDDGLCNATNVATPASLPTPLAPGQALAVDLDLVPTQIGSVIRDFRFDGVTFFTVGANVTPAGTCSTSAGNVLCLQDDRFKVRTLWRRSNGARGLAPIVPGVNSDDSGLFYFFNPNNWEMLMKVLDGCPVNNRFWVFYAATTNVEFTITVTDTQEQEVSTYFNPLNRPAPPVQDTEAFATCP
jgi:hypothetical protein